MGSNGPSPAAASIGLSGMAGGRPRSSGSRFGPCPPLTTPSIGSPTRSRELPRTVCEILGVEEVLDGMPDGSRSADERSEKPKGAEGEEAGRLFVRDVEDWCDEGRRERDKAKPYVGGGEQKRVDPVLDWPILFCDRQGSHVGGAEQSGEKP